MVGRLHEHKDHETLIHSIALLPTNYHLHLAGDGAKRGELESLTQSLNIADRIHFHGVVSDIPAFCLAWTCTFNHPMLKVLALRL